MTTKSNKKTIKTTKVKTASDRKGSLNINTTLHRKEQVVYYSNKYGMTNAAFVERAIDEYIAKLNGDYDIPNITVSRIDQLAENTELIREELKLLRYAINNGFGAIFKHADD